MNQGQVVRWPVPQGVPLQAALLRRAPQPLRAALFAAVLGRPAGSPLRRRLLGDAVRVGFDLLNHRDQHGVVDQILRFYDPACEIHVGPGFPLDAEPVYHGHPGWRALIRAWDETAAMSLVPKEALDMGGACFAVLVSVGITGTESGASTPAQAVYTYTVRRGLIARQDMRIDGWDAAPAELAAALQRLIPETEKPSPTPT